MGKYRRQPPVSVMFYILPILGEPENLGELVVHNENF